MSDKRPITILLTIEDSGQLSIGLAMADVGEDSAAAHFSILPGESFAGIPYAELLALGDGDHTITPR